ncbi:Nucleoside-diphosphate-sugar epimerase [Streptomyces sp. DvalAA-14]|uniref:NAD-dependent epimerase/dehydratase family protein n=1 Tax=unclassified Streptomyces TaxID=2593676 RepID=UPI00081B54BC|nr:MULTISPECIES: NAD(P)-dependent oxidoreductase [unclassified Streptomyces]MYS24590.1 NAD-dependent epimerase/dehydratase family protein [Streptomyces sp. SID4948]SCE47514.1 Nucleoside-diphosphate-sugar epimerase [Streptomyces sp. DvalAA-14]
MRILVTGSTGEVGRRFVPRLLARAAGAGTVRILVRDRTRAEALTRLGAETLAGDLRELADLRAAVDGVDAVVNVAASFRGVPDEDAWAVNRDAALALGLAAQEAGVTRFVQVSTNLVYGAGHGRPAVEDDQPHPGSPLEGAYPQSKRAAEAGLLALHRDSGLDVRIGRLAYVYGEGDPHLTAVLHRAAHWPAHQRMMMVHHADTAQGLLRLLYAPGIAGRAYNIADDAPMTAVELHQLNGVPVPEGMADRPLPDPWHGIVSTVRIRDELGYRPLYPSAWAARDAGVL